MFLALHPRTVKPMATHRPMRCSTVRRAATWVLDTFLGSGTTLLGARAPSEGSAEGWSSTQSMWIRPSDAGSG